MACKCLEEIPKKIKAHCNEQKEYQVNPVEDVSFKDVVFLTHDFGLQAVLKADMALRIKGRKTPKKAPFTFVFCPFCGVKYQEDV